MLSDIFHSSGTTSSRRRRLTPLRRMAALGTGSFKLSQKGVTLTGDRMASLLLVAAPRIPVRDLDRLEGHYGGLSGPALAGAVIRAASRRSAAVGSVVGALASVEELVPPAWIVLPVELLTETMLIAIIEMKLVAELHAIYRRPIVGNQDERATAIVTAWAERRGVRIEALDDPADGENGLAQIAGRGTRRELMQSVRRRVLIKVGRNVSTLAPLLVGAVTGAEVNRRATRGLGDALVADLAGGGAKGCP